MRQAMLPAGGAYVKVTLSPTCHGSGRDGSVRVETIYLPDLLMHFTICEAAASEDAAKRRVDHEISQRRDVRG